VSHYDVIVVGAGPAGAATAALFAEQGRRVLLVDKARFPRPKACAEYVSPGGVAIIGRLGALTPIESTGKRRWLRGMAITAPSGQVHLADCHDADGQPRRGLAVARLVLDLILLEMAANRGAEVRQGFGVRRVLQSAGRVCGVVGPTGERVQADLVVGADGLHSIIARQLAQPRNAPWPRRLGLIAHYSDVDWPEDYGHILVGSNGYAGAAPLDHDGLVTLGLVRRMPPVRLGSPAAALEAELAGYPSLAKRLRDARLSGPVMGVGPLARRVRRAAGAGFALVGDAAGFFDPFTGEGIYRALRGAELLADCPETYARTRAEAFRAKERLVMLLQVLVQLPRLTDFAVSRLQSRAEVAAELANMVGDLCPPRLGVLWRLLGP
jgi:flavin-dependent dehydrogenase